MLQTDHFDLFQFHAVTTDEDVDKILAPGGALEAFAEAREHKAGDPTQPSCSDCVVNGIAMRRSLDGGRSWHGLQWVVADTATTPSDGRPGMNIGGNPTAVFDAVRSRIVLQFTRGLRNAPPPAQSCNPALSNWQTLSADGGKTWSQPTEEEFPTVFTFMRDVDFERESDVGYIVGQQGMILRSTDGGRSWSQVLPSEEIGIGRML